MQNFYSGTRNRYFGNPMQKTTTDHKEIQQWAAAHEGKPAVIDHPEAEGDKIGIRIDFPGDSDERLLGDNETKNVSWDEFFAIFEREGFAFVYDEDPTSDDPTQ